MKRYLLASAVVLSVVAVPVLAQENTITIIHEDGSQDVIQLGGKKAPAPAPAPKSAPRVEVETKPAPQPVTEVAPVPEAVPAQEPVAAEPIMPKVERIAEPVSKPVPKKEEKKAAPVKSVQKTGPQKAAPRDPLAFVPLRKPHRRVITQDTVITKEKALYIALGEAPPSRDVQVMERDGAYSVIFKTEDGPYEVLIDASNGVVQRSGLIEQTAPVTKPGHLPARPKAKF